MSDVEDPEPPEPAAEAEPEPMPRIVGMVAEALCPVCQFPLSLNVHGACAGGAPSAA